MKLQCTNELLRNAVQLLSSVCPTRTTLPIISSLYVRAESGTLHMTATDLDMSVRTSITAEVSKKGETTIPAKVLLDALRKINAPAINLSVDAKNVTMLSAGDKISCSLRGMAPADFPKFPELEDSETLEMPAKELANMIKFTSYAASRDESRYTLNGVCLNFGEKLDVVATDGRRIAKCTNASTTRSSEEKRLIVPTKSVNMMMQILVGEGSVQLRYTSKQLEVTKGSTTMVTRLIDGEFPNYRNVIPGPGLYTVSVNKKRFSDAVGLAVVVTEKMKQSVVRVAVDKETLTVSANTAEIGEVQDVIDVKYKGEPVDMAFNPAFLMDVCQNVDTEELVMEFGTGLNPVVFRAGDTFLCVIMPMRI